MADRKVSYHSLFVFSPVMLFCVLLIAIFFDSIALIDVLITIIKGYTIFYLIVCSYIVFKYKNKRLKSKWNSFLVRSGYSIAASTFFSWIFLLPFMKGTVGMWESQFLNMLVTLALGYFAFFFLIGIYHLTSLLLPGKKAHS